MHEVEADRAASMAAFPERIDRPEGVDPDTG
jgi:hypothetical protein